MNLAILAEGEILGYEDLLNGRSHSFSARATQVNTILYFIRARRLHQAINIAEDYKMQRYLKLTSKLKN